MVRVIRLMEVILQLTCNSYLNIIFTDVVHVSLHQGADSLIHCFRFHLKRVTDLDSLDAIEGVFASDWLVRVQSVNFEVVLRLFE